MKKIVLFAVAAIAVSFASCGNASKSEAETVQETVETAIAAADSVAAAVVDSVAVVVDSAAVVK